MSAKLHSTLPMTAWLPLQNAAGAVRDECSSLEQLVQELFADLDRSSAELEARADELEEGRHHLAERGRQLAEHRKESARLSHQLEQQETQLSEALAELRELRAELASQPEPVPGPELRPELEGLRQQLADLQIERALLRERLEAAAKNVPAADPTALQFATEDLLQTLSRQFAGQLSELQKQLQTSQPGPTAALDLTELKQTLLDQHHAQITRALTELQDTQAERFAKQLAQIQQQIAASQPGPSVAMEVESLKQSLLEQHESQLALALAELRELRAELTLRAESPTAEDYESAALRQQVTELEVERAVQQERLEAAALQLHSDEARAHSQEKFAALIDRFTHQFADLQGQIQVLRQDQPEIAELDSLKAERLELEAELEIVRARSAALQETVALQKRELASQRASVSEELQELRGLLAEQTRLITERGPAPSPPLVPLPLPLPQPQVEKEPSLELILDDTCSKHLDPVVNSVMAQFAKLQKDIAQRRRKK